MNLANRFFSGSNIIPSCIEVNTPWATKAMMTIATR